MKSLRTMLYQSGMIYVIVHIGIFIFWYSILTFLFIFNHKVWKELHEKRVAIEKGRD